MKPPHLKPRLAACCLAALTLVSAPAHAVDDNEIARFLAVGGSLASWGLAVWQGAPLTDCDQARWHVRGVTARDAELQAVSLGMAWGDCHLLGHSGWDLSHQTGLMFSQWWARGLVPGHDSAWDMALVPLLHWRHPAPQGLLFDVEVGVGPAWLSQPRVGRRDKSTQLQFSDHVGLGLSNAARTWRLGLSWRHVSNADIATPNQTVDFKGVALSLAF